MSRPAAVWWTLCAGSLIAHLGGTAMLRVTLAIPAPAPTPPHEDLIFLGAILPAPPAPGPTAPDGRGASPGAILPEPPPALWLWPPPPLTPEPWSLAEPLANTWLTRPQERPPIRLAATKQRPRTVTAIVETSSVATAPAWIRGPARARALLHRPPLAPYLTRVPLTRLRSGDIPDTLELELRFTLSHEGEVDAIQIVRSSGDPLLDLVGLQYLKEWRFAPADTLTARRPKESWGQVTLRLGVERRS